MKYSRIIIAIFLSMFVTKALAYDFAIENADGMTIYYNYISNGKELEVTYKTNSYNSYNGSVVIPEEVTYMNRTRKVTSIGSRAFSNCSSLTSISIPNSVTIIKERAFGECFNLTSVTIPNSVTIIEKLAFTYCTGLTSVVLGTNLKSIGEWAFQSCRNIVSITIPDSVNAIEESAFISCEGLITVTIGNGVTSIGNQAFYGCENIVSLTIGSNVKTIGEAAFLGCGKLSNVNIPNSVTDIKKEAFAGCISLTSLFIGNNVSAIEEKSFQYCRSLTSITIPNSVKRIGDNAFDGWDLPVVISLIENPFGITGKDYGIRTFSQNTFNNATLYVPKGTIDKYKTTSGWEDFLFIEEGTGPNDNPSTMKCEMPTISYLSGKLSFNSATDGVTYHFDITDSDIKSGSAQELDLSVTYNIRVYATKDGYENSDVATATLCWIDVEPKTDGLSNIAQVRANAVMIKAEDGLLTIEGADDNTNIVVYTLDGVQVGSTISKNGIAHVSTNLIRDNIAIMKIGNRSIKVMMK